MFLFRLFARYLPIAIMMTSLPANATQNTTSLLIFGDSLSAGYGIERGQEWPSLLQKRLGDTKIDVTIINHSISGETTSGGVQRLHASLDEVKPDILFLALGANDGLRGLSLKAMKDNLQQMITMALKRRIQVVLVGMRLPSNYGPAFTQLFHQQYIELARTNPVVFLPFLLEQFGDDISWFQEDGLHPTQAAQELILAHVWQTLEPLFKPEKR